MLDENKNFIFMRRVKPEIEMLEKGVNSPFDKLKKLITYPIMFNILGIDYYE